MWQTSPSGFPYPLLSTGCPFLIKSLALLAHVSPWTIHFRVLDKSPLSDPGRGPPSCNRLIQIVLLPPSGCRVRQIWLLWLLDVGLPVRSLLVFPFSGFLAKKTRFPWWFIGAVLHVLYFIMYFFSFFFSFPMIVSSLGFLVAQSVKNLPAMWKI